MLYPIIVWLDFLGLLGNKSSLELEYEFYFRTVGFDIEVYFSKAALSCLIKF